MTIARRRCQQPVYATRRYG